MKSNNNFGVEYNPKQKNKYIVIAVIIIILTAVTLIGSCVFYKKQGNKNSTTNQTSSNIKTSSENKIEDNKIVLADGTVINLASSTATTASSTTSSSQTSSSNGSTNNTSGGSSSNQSSSNSTSSNSTSGGTTSGGSSGGSQTTPPPNSAGNLWSEKDYSYNDSTVTSPTSDYLLAKFDLTNDTGKNLTMDKAEVTFAFQHNFDENDLANVYIKINNKKYAVKNTVTASANSWVINDTIANQTTVKIEIYGDIKSGTGDDWADSRVISLMKLQATEKNGSTIYYSGTDNTNTYTVGQSVYVKTTIAQTTLPAQTTPPPAQTTPPSQTNPTSTPSTQAGYIIVQDALTSVEKADYAKLIGSYRNDLRFSITAKNESMDLTGIEISINNNSTQTTIEKAVKEVLLSQVDAIGVKIKDLGNATLTKSGLSGYKVELSGTSLFELTKDQPKYIAVNMYYYDASAAGAILKSQLNTISTTGKSSQQKLNFYSNNTTYFPTSIISGTSYLVSTEPLIYALQVGDTNLQGGSQKEIYRFGLGAVANPDYSASALVVNYIDINLEKTDVTVKNVGLYSLVGSNWTLEDNCFALNQNKWRCGGGIMQSINNGQSNLTFSIRADLGLKTNASLKSYLNTGNLTSSGNIIWTDKIGGKEYYWMTKLNSNENLTTLLSGSGNGILFDSTGPKLSAILQKTDSCKDAVSGDYIMFIFDENIDPTSISSIAKSPDYNYASDDQPGSVVICNNTSNNKLQTSYLSVNNMFEYDFPANNESCKKYSTKWWVKGKLMYVYLTNNGTAISSLPINTINLRDANGNVAPSPSPAPGGTLNCP